MRNKRGFTLVELMIVVVIIGLLAAIALPKFNMAAHKSKEKEADVFLSYVFRLQEVYRAENGQYATTALELQNVGFRAPARMDYYTWPGTVVLPLCLSSRGSWPGRRLNADGSLVSPC